VPQTGNANRADAFLNGIPVPAAREKGDKRNSQRERKEMYEMYEMYEICERRDGAEG
jgi:hypothetical protein